jgi:hypothetical protein
MEKEMEAESFMRDELPSLEPTREESAGGAFPLSVCCFMENELVDKSNKKKSYGSIANTHCIQNSVCSVYHIHVLLYPGRPRAPVRCSLVGIN